MELLPQRNSVHTGISSMPADAYHHTRSSTQQTEGGSKHQFFQHSPAAALKYWQHFLSPSWGKFSGPSGTSYPCAVCSFPYIYRLLKTSGVTLDSATVNDSWSLRARREQHIAWLFKGTSNSTHYQNHPH